MHCNSGSRLEIWEYVHAKMSRFFFKNLFIVYFPFRDMFSLMKVGRSSPSEPILTPCNSSVVACSPSSNLGGPLPGMTNSLSSYLRHLHHLFGLQDSTLTAQLSLWRLDIGTLTLFNLWKQLPLWQDSSLFRAQHCLKGENSLRFFSLWRSALLPDILAWFFIGTIRMGFVTLACMLSLWSLVCTFHIAQGMEIIFAFYHYPSLALWSNYRF